MFSHIWYNYVMNSQVYLPKVYTPDQVAEMLQLSTNTIYELIAKGEIAAKRIGKTLRIPASSISFVFSGLDNDLLKAEGQDKINLPTIEKELSSVRRDL